MATSNGLGAFSKRMKIVAAKVGDNARDIVRAAAISADTTAVITTPVDSGRARANWLTSIGEPDTRVEAAPIEGNGEASATKAISQGNQVINGWELGGGSIFIANSVAYIVPLDEGSSRQAPQGMTKQAVQSARVVLGTSKLLEGL